MMNLDSAPYSTRSFGPSLEQPSAVSLLHTWTPDLYDEFNGYLTPTPNCYPVDNTVYTSPNSYEMAGSYMREDVTSLAAQLCDITAADAEPSPDDQTDANNNSCSVLATDDLHGTTTSPVATSPEPERAKILTPLESSTLEGYKQPINPPHDWFYPTHGIHPMYPDVQTSDYGSATSAESCDMVPQMTPHQDTPHGTTLTELPMSMCSTPAGLRLQEMTLSEQAELAAQDNHIEHQVEHKINKEL